MCGIAPGGAIMAATHKTKGAFEGAEGAICLTPSKAPLVFCVLYGCQCDTPELSTQLITMEQMCHHPIVRRAD